MKSVLVFPFSGKLAADGNYCYCPHFSNYMRQCMKCSVGCSTNGVRALVHGRKYPRPNLLQLDAQNRLPPQGIIDFAVSKTKTKFYFSHMGGYSESRLADLGLFLYKLYSEGSSLKFCYNFGVYNLLVESFCDHFDIEVHHWDSYMKMELSTHDVAQLKVRVVRTCALHKLGGFSDLMANVPVLHDVDFFNYFRAAEMDSVSYEDGKVDSMKHQFISALNVTWRRECVLHFFRREDLKNLSAHFMHGYFHGHTLGHQLAHIALIVPSLDFTRLGGPDCFIERYKNSTAILKVMASWCDDLLPDLCITDASLLIPLKSFGFFARLPKYDRSSVKIESFSDFFSTRYGKGSCLNNTFTDDDLRAYKDFFGSSTCGGTFQYEFREYHHYSAFLEDVVGSSPDPILNKLVAANSTILELNRIVEKDLAAEKPVDVEALTTTRSRNRKGYLSRTKYRCSVKTISCTTRALLVAYLRRDCILRELIKHVSSSGTSVWDLAIRLLSSGMTISKVISLLVPAKSGSSEAMVKAFESDRLIAWYSKFESTTILVSMDVVKSRYSLSSNFNF